MKVKVNIADPGVGNDGNINLENISGGGIVFTFNREAPGQIPTLRISVDPNGITTNTLTVAQLNNLLGTEGIDMTNQQLLGNWTVTGKLTVTVAGEEISWDKIDGGDQFIQIATGKPTATAGMSYVYADSGTGKLMLTNGVTAASPIVTVGTLPAALDVTKLAEEYLGVSYVAPVGTINPSTTPSGLIHYRGCASGVLSDAAALLYDETTTCWYFCWNTGADGQTIGNPATIKVGSIRVNNSVIDSTGNYNLDISSGAFKDGSGHIVAGWGADLFQITKSLLWYGLATTAAPAVSPGNEGNLYYNSTLNRLMISCNGGAYAKLVDTGTLAADGAAMFDAHGAATTAEDASTALLYETALQPYAASFGTILDVRTSPPVAPANGDKYLVDAPATGLWTGKEYHTVTWNAAGSIWADGGAAGDGLFSKVDRSQQWWIFTTALGTPARKIVAANTLTEAGVEAVFGTSVAKNKFLGSPQGTTGGVSLRVLTTDDIPDLSSYYLSATATYNKNLVVASSATADGAVLGVRALVANDIPALAYLATNGTAADSTKWASKAWPTDAAGVLTNDGSGNISWGASSAPTLTATEIGFGSGSNTLSGSAYLTYSSGQLAVTDIPVAGTTMTKLWSDTVTCMMDWTIFTQFAATSQWLYSVIYQELYVFPLYNPSSYTYVSLSGGGGILSSPCGMTAWGNYCYISSANGNTYIYAYNGTTWINSGTLATGVGGNQWGQAISPDGTKLFMNANNVWRIYDIGTDKLSPVLLGSVACGSAWNSCNCGVLAALTNTYAVIGGYTGSTGRWAIVDFSTPSTPVEVYNGTIASSGWISRPVIDGNYCYLTDGYKKFWVYDITTKSAPSLAGSASFTMQHSSSKGTWAKINKMLYGWNSDGSGHAQVCAIDVTTPASPVIYENLFDMGATAGNDIIAMGASGNNILSLCTADNYTNPHNWYLNTGTSAGTPIVTNGYIQSQFGGFKFPDNSVLSTAVKSLSVPACLCDTNGVQAQTVACWTAPYACTVTSVKAWRADGSSGTTTINAVRNRSGSTTNLLSANLTLTNATTLYDGGAVQNTAIQAGDIIEFTVASNTNNATQIFMQVNLTNP